MLKLFLPYHQTLNLIFYFTQIYNASSVDELNSAIDKASCYLQLAGCFMPVRALDDKFEIVNAAVKFHVIYRVQHGIDGQV